jgi:hypothetical protein
MRFFLSISIFLQLKTELMLIINIYYQKNVIILLIFLFAYFKPENFKTKYSSWLRSKDNIFKIDQIELQLCINVIK